MKTNLLFLSLFSLLLVACGGDEEPEVDLSGYHISFKFDGELEQLVLGGDDVLDFTWTGGRPDAFDPPEENFYGDYGAGFSNISETYGMTITRVITYNNGEYVDNPQGKMNSWFTNGTHSYSTDASEDGFHLEFWTGGVSYRTYFGAQGGSVFTITETNPIDLDVYPELIVRGTFNCKLYEEGSATAHEVTEGSFQVRFSL